MTDSKWFIYPELTHVNNMYLGSVNNSYPDSVRKKYAASWDMYRKHYPKLTTYLLLSGNNVTAISPDVEWDEVVDRHPESCKYAIEKIVKY
ncbi:hypothetical protein Q7607_00500 [Klebsiella pneumoniae]|nr:hypothetical protein [Klebsiella pneumoniae]QGV84947.1 hypothetical protein F7P09_21760 [Klebsiella pneumoniae]HCH9878125.1 hypothetical protein [Klebsiella pneumoniae]